MKRRPIPALAVLLFLFGIWGAWFIYRSSFVVDGKRYFTLFDDSMISMTYAHNLVEGYGLNWARWGQPVEGFTHPLWLLVMIPVNALPIALRDRSLLMQLISLLTLGGTIVAVRRLMLDHFSPEGERHWMLAATITAFYYPLAYWGLMGMETGLQALLAVLAVHLALSIVHSGSDRHFALWLAGTAAVLLRLDMLFLFAAVELYVLLRGGLRQASRPSWLAGLAVFCAATGGYEVFRWLYFHDLLPNTYYLKLTGVPLAVRFLKGLWVLTGFLREHLVIVLAAAMGTVAFWRRNHRLALPAAIIMIYFAYNVYIGGDAWDGDIEVRANRFLAFVMPLLFVLLNAALNEALALWRSRGESSADDPAGRFAVAAATVLALLLANGLLLSGRADGNWNELMGTARPPLTDRHQKALSQLQGLQRMVRPGAVVATAWAGIPAYFSDYRMIDILGYNDRVVARMPPVVALTEDDFQLYRPGHVKWNEQRLLMEQRPDAFFQIWGVRRGMGKVHEVMPLYGYRRVSGFWVRSDSPYVHAPEAVIAPTPLAAAEVLDFHRKRRVKRPS